MYDGQMEPDKCHVEAAHEEADGEQPEALRLERLLQRVFAALRDRRAGLWGRGALFAQSEGKRHHQHRHHAEDEHGRMPVVEPILQQRRERHDGELTKRSAGGRDTKRDRAFLGRRLPADGAEDRPEPRGRHADAAQHIAEREHDAFGRERDHEHADDVKHAAGGDGPRRAKAIRDVADERRERAHQQHRQRVGERPQLAPDVEIGCDRLLKDAEALARADPDGEDHGPADHGDPEASLLRLGG